jgi:1-deoxy-D-xylulose-5-phosphate synthase
MLQDLVTQHKVMITVEDGCAVNGFGACVAAAVESMAPELRLGVLGTPDRTFEHASRSQQLEAVGLTAKGIAARLRVLATEESLSTA